MRKIKEVLYAENIGSGYLYFYIHLITEVVCFYILSNLFGYGLFLWIAPLLYDSLAFVPQSIIGYISDKIKNINFGLLGIFLLIIALITFSMNLLPGNYTELIILCLGNACIHISGAEVTIRSSKGKLSHSAIFVAGGSFGVIIGKLLGKTSISFWFITILALTTIPFILLAEYYRKEADKKELPCKNFNYHNENIDKFTVVLLAVLIVIVRGYMGYGIPTSWNKTKLQAILLYFTMGFGKAFGGILSDIFGIRKIAFISILLSLPFLLVGDNLMIISLIGVLLFSMTMSITLGLLVSVLKETPGLAFGLTTIGLFLGTAPIFFFEINSNILNGIIITILTILCLFVALKIIRKEQKNG